MKFLALTVLMIGSLSGLGLHSAASWQGQTKQRFTQADEDSIREAVFRYQFEHNASGQQQKAKVYFLSIGKNEDPSDAFMARFDKHKPPVKKRSQATGKFEVIDKQTGERGLIFGVTTIEKLDEDKATVDGGYYEAGLSASGNTYTVERKDNKWVVTKDQMRWIS